MHADALLGVTLAGRFRLVAALIVDDAGAIYEAVQEPLGRHVALRVIWRDRLLEGASSALLADALTLSAMTHPHLVRLFDFGEDAEHGVLYLVMELLRATPLRELLHERRLDPALAMVLFTQAIGALTEPHSVGLYHHDLRPEHLLILARVDGDAQLKVIDHGLARALRDAPLTRAAARPYAAPERLAGQGGDGRADLYAMGVILYEMLTGRLPFDPQSPAEDRQTIPTFAQRAPGAEIPHALEALTRDLLSPRPEDRPESALVLRDQLDQLIDHLNFKRIRVPAGDSAHARLSAWLLPLVELPPEPEPAPAVAPLSAGADQRATLLGFGAPVLARDDPARQRLGAPLVGASETQTRASRRAAEPEPAPASASIELAISAPSLADADAAVAAPPQPFVDQDAAVAAPPRADADAATAAPVTPALEDAFFSQSFDASASPDHLVIDDAMPQPDQGKARLMVGILIGVALLVGLGVFALVKSDLGTEPDPDEIAAAAARRAAAPPPLQTQGAADAQASRAASTPADPQPDPDPTSADAAPAQQGPRPDRQARPSAQRLAASKPSAAPAQPVKAVTPVTPATQPKDEPQPKAPSRPARTSKPQPDATDAKLKKNLDWLRQR